MTLRSSTKIERQQCMSGNSTYVINNSSIFSSQEWHISFVRKRTE